MKKKSIYIFTVLLVLNLGFFGLASILSKKINPSTVEETHFLDRELIKSGWHLLNWSNTLLHYFSPQK
jgi:hypothetical protein